MSRSSSSSHRHQPGDFTADRRVLLLDPAPLFSYAGAMAPSLPGMLSWAAIGLLAGLGSGG